jgi:hypothetical protein
VRKFPPLLVQKQWSTDGGFWGPDVNVLRCQPGFMCLIACVFALGCTAEGPKLHPVNGKVFYLEQPADGATVVFQSVGGDPEAAMPSGLVKADGSFALSTPTRGAGAPAGEYIVLITWYPPDARDQNNPKNRLPAKFGSAATTPLKATVKEGTNELEPFRLTK